ncbi:hypothetical protein KUV51_12210 [Tateyamaria omphalii]|uniref:hypothetical protein n=1 Tax=Tateyamaria omphalii TaxID=299262 RepID=UPI001C990291|nr:hypothetical protein [Tateyamaria omphalii]MBY5933766.1 hypothetical protein [Tateyamaria omphalii]
MKHVPARLSVLPMLMATPALAHHEVAVVSSILPLMGGIAVIAIAGIGALRKHWRK